MVNANITVLFDPEKLKAYAKNEASMDIVLTSASDQHYWCECEVFVKAPLSLANDKELSGAKLRIGILRPRGTKEKKIKLYTRPNNFPDPYNVNIVAYLYDEDGAIAERIEQNTDIMCEA